MNWSFGNAIAAGALHVAPPSHVWLTITSLFVTAAYGSAGTGAAAFRSSNHTTAKWFPLVSVGSAVMLPCMSSRNSESCNVWRPSTLTGKSPSLIPSYACPIRQVRAVGQRPGGRIQHHRVMLRPTEVRGAVRCVFVRVVEGGQHLARWRDRDRVAPRLVAGVGRGEPHARRIGPRDVRRGGPGRSPV